MESLTINFCYSLADQEIKLANIDKLKLLLYLCEAKLTKDIDLPLKRVTVIGTDYVTEPYRDLISELHIVAKQSRRLGLSFTIWEKYPQNASDFKL
ncbi:Uncharacterised protein [Phocoenobacter uteri]|uniref:Uncharacterized protein n=1 Tax=Phocoenobacter uteri TaxID=146806 RepID=A0A379DEQ6_9PAST|nr:hypothetical protein [Phocoenobacter uteri]MDG6882818.1 hypothetical protein [Phocoenobacter uteri]SUB76397.1 Uncharacterised protein [Phocoenobacter uteri]